MHGAVGRIRTFDETMIIQPYLQSTGTYLIEMWWKGMN